MTTTTKLSQTAERSLRNLADGPVAFYGNCLRARQIHGLSIDALERKGYAKTTDIACTGGCRCDKNETNATPVRHYVITEAGREALGLPATIAASGAVTVNLTKSDAFHGRTTCATDPRLNGVIGREDKGRAEDRGRWFAETKAHYASSITLAGAIAKLAREIGVEVRVHHVPGFTA